jgi:subtilisin family serine protease
LHNRYIVTLREGLAAEQVNGVAISFANRFGGHLLGTMTHAMKGFGVAMTEAQARALSHEPDVSLVEEDSEIQLSGGSPTSGFSFDATRTATHMNPAFHFRGNPLSNTFCPWNSSGYYVCTYGNDTWWNLDRLDNRGNLTGTRAYAYATDGTGVRVYVVDSGVYAAHSEFDSPTRVESGANMTVDTDATDVIQRQDEEWPITYDTAPATNPCNGWRTLDYDIATHGTKVASIIAGTTSGVAKNVTIVPVKVISCPSSEGANTLASKLAVARGLDWILGDMSGRSSRAVVNMSIFWDTSATENGQAVSTQVCEDGSGGYTNCIAAVENEINNIIGANIPVVVSANNQGNGNCSTSPARMGYGGTFATTHHTITVGATQYSFSGGTYPDTRWSDATGASNYGACVSIWAPGASIRAGSGTGPSAFTTESGTSLSAPYTAGVVARILQAHPTYTPNDVWAALVDGATNQRWATTVAPFDSTGNNKLVYLDPTD